jgi:hypothetical protein
MRDARNAYRILVGNLLESSYLKDQGTRKKTLRWVLGKSVVRMSGDNWLKLMFSAGLWY